MNYTLVNYEIDVAQLYEELSVGNKKMFLEESIRDLRRADAVEVVLNGTEWMDEKYQEDIIKECFKRITKNKLWLVDYLVHELSPNQQCQLREALNKLEI